MEPAKIKNVDALPKFSSLSVTMIDLGEEKIIILARRSTKLTVPGSCSSPPTSLSSRTTSTSATLRFALLCLTVGTVRRGGGSQLLRVKLSPVRFIFARDGSVLRADILTIVFLMLLHFGQFLFRATPSSFLADRVAS